MKTNLISVLCAASSVAVLAGCTSNTTATTKPAGYDQTQKRVYTKEQMDKTGRQTPGAALEQLDPSVTVTGNGR